MKRASRLRFLCLVVLLSVVSGCVKRPADLPALGRLETFGFDPASRLEDRITVIPPAMLNHYRDWDKRPDYAAYKPSDSDKALLMEYLRLLPPVYERTFKARCAGIYFVSGLMGNGITTWVIGPEDKVYFNITLNPAALKTGLSETLTKRERSCFIPRSGWDVKVDAGGKYKGLLYALLHEGAHGLDYAAGISPYCDDTMPKYYWPAESVSGSFFYKTWSGYSVPYKRSDFHGRDLVTFYGLGGGPKIDITEAKYVYEGLKKSPFMSLYGSKSWAEDLAELATFAVLTGKLGQPYKVLIQYPDSLTTLEPMKGDAGARAGEALSLLEKIK